MHCPMKDALFTLAQLSGSRSPAYPHRSSSVAARSSLPQVQLLGLGPIYQVGRALGDQLGEGIVVSQFKRRVGRSELLQRRRHMLIE